MSILLASIAAFLASLYGTTVGGAGLIIVPVLIFLGLSAQEAVATTIFSYMGMNLVGLYTFHHANKINYRIGFIGSAIVMLGAIVGSFILISISEELLKRIIGWFILLSPIILLLPKQYGINKHTPSSFMNYIGYFLLFPLGILSGFIAGGIAIIGSYILLIFFGLSFTECAATRKVIFLARTLVLILIFAYSGLIRLEYGIPMLFLEGVGAYIGTVYALQKGDGWIRYLFIVIVVLSGMKLIW